MADSELATTKPSTSCHRRKIKCVSGDADGCQGCGLAGLACTYHAIPQKKGPKGKKAKVLTALHVEQRNASSGSGPLQEVKHSPSMHCNLRTPDLLTPAILHQCIDFFFTNIYPLQPILQLQHMHEAIADMDTLANAYPLVFAFCAYSMLQTDTEVSFDPFERIKTVQMGRALLEESCRLQDGHSYCRNPTHRTIFTLWFCHGCYLELEESDIAWCYLRDATTQALLLGMHYEKTYSLDLHDAPQKRALYWLLFIAER